jgi:opacity protein-like surface antigen
MFGVFLLGEYPVTDYLKFYAVAGFSSVEVKYSPNYPGFNDELSQEDTIFSASIGLEIQPIKNLGIYLEYSELLDGFYEPDELDEVAGFEIDYDMSAISLGFKYYF